MSKITIYIGYLMACLCVSCAMQVENPEFVDAFPEIYPDYVNVTIPVGIAPLNFNLKEDYERIDVILQGTDGEKMHLNDNEVDIDACDWEKLLEKSEGDSVTVTISVRNDGKWKQYKSFSFYVSDYPIDYGLAYRLIAPGYEVYSKMGIYQRELGSFKENAVIENTLLPGMCVNCHSANMTNPNNLSIHVRGDYGATLMKYNSQLEVLDTKTDSTISSCVYPYWHPSGNYIAYSVNDTKQAFHVVRNERIEVMDNASDVVVYNPQTHRLLMSPLLCRKESFETFPAFSADGTKLYFCSAEAQVMPENYKNVRYSLCSIDFDPTDGTFGNKVDTLISAVKLGKSISFPRPSYNGRYIMYTLSDYGNFSIWHREADLWLLDLRSGISRNLIEVNSQETESFHNWSSNSHWFVFSSRRDDGLYTRLYLASINEKGEVSKPFMLPQQNPLEYYTELLYSYNVPDFISEPIVLDKLGVEKGLKSKNKIKLKIDTY